MIKVPSEMVLKFLSSSPWAQPTRAPPHNAVGTAEVTFQAILVRIMLFTTSDFLEVEAKCEL